jgi:hypothetical protein
MPQWAMAAAEQARRNEPGRQAGPSGWIAWPDRN